MMTYSTFNKNKIKDLYCFVLKGVLRLDLSFFTTKSDLKKAAVISLTFNGGWSQKTWLIYLCWEVLCYCASSAASV